MEIIAELQQITAGYADEIILKNVNLNIRNHDFIGVIGPNGGGKTTLVKVILGLLKPMSGQIILHQNSQSDNRSIIGYLPQVNRTDLKFPISVLDVVLSGLTDAVKPFKRFTRNDISRARELLNQMGIVALAKKNIGDLSGGQMQRVFLCRAIISNPRQMV